MNKVRNSDSYATLTRDEHERRINLGEVKAKPRPTSTCTKCQEIVTLVYGDVMAPHWRHKSKRDDHDVTGAGESFIHRQAKDRLTLFLNNGGRCDFKHHCNDKVILSPLDLKWVTEHRIGARVLDIAGINSKGDVKWCIEIYHTNATTDDEVRSKLTWVEVDAIKTYSSLLARDADTILYLVDTSRKSCCNVMKPDTKIPKKPKRTVKPMITTPATRDQFNTLARELGYLRLTPYMNDYGLIIITPMWTTIGYLCCNDKACSDRKNWTRSWKKFRCYQKCIGCMRDWKIKFLKPFCMECYKAIKTVEAIGNKL